MSLLDMFNFIRYTGGDLDRASGMRKDPIWVSEQFCNNHSQIIPIWRDLNLIEKHSNTNTDVSHLNFDGKTLEAGYFDQRKYFHTVWKTDYV